MFVAKSILQRRGSCFFLLPWILKFYLQNILHSRINHWLL